MLSVRQLITLEEKASAGSSRVLNALERTRLQTDEVPNTDHRLYELMMKSCDARRAELLIRKEKGITPLLHLRALLFRGKFNEAKKASEVLPKDQSHQTLQDSELMLEQARLLLFQGRWKESFEMCNQAIALETAPVSLLSLLQCRALVQSEMGFIREGLQDLVEADSLIEIFPNARSGFYAKVLRIRLTATLEANPKSYKRALKLLWALASEADAIGELNADYILTLLRTEIALRRMQGTCIASAAAASFRIAEMMGDRLYAGLALVDVLSCGNTDLRTSLQTRIESDSSEFERVRKLCEEIATPEGSDSFVSETARGIRNQICGKDHVCLDQSLLDEALKSEKIVLPVLGVAVQLSPWSIQKVLPQGRSLQILNSLDNQSIDRDVLFKSIWKTKYVSHLHDPLIWKTLSRFSKKTGIKIENGKNIKLVNSWVVKSCFQS